MLRHTASVLSAFVAVLALGASQAAAVPAVSQEIPLTGEPKRVAQGPDGNMWVTIGGSSKGNEIAKITPAGEVSEIDVDQLAGGIGITAGPDGNLWVTKPTAVVRFAPNDPTGALAFPADIVQAQTIVTGPDGNLWTASADKVIRIGADGKATPFTVVSGARGIASSGGLLWVADFGANAVVSVTTDGKATPYPTGGGPQEVAGGPNGQVAYSDPGTTPHTVGRMVSGGSPLLTETPLSDPFGVTLGADGAYWFAQFASNDLGRLTPDGQYTRLTGFSAGAGPRYVAAGPGNTLWVTLDGAKAVARVTGVDPAVQPPPPTGDTVRPALRGLALSGRRLCAGGARTPVRVTATRCKKALRLRFRLSEAARVTVRFEHRVKRRWVRSGRLVRPGKAGANSVRFTGRLGGRRLASGTYRLTVAARDSTGLVSTRKRTAAFVVVR